MKPKLYGVYTARFPFLKSADQKIRPVVIISKPTGKYRVLTAVPITSKIDRDEFDFEIKGWAEAGLIKLSVIRVHRISTILESRLVAELGSLPAGDIKKLQESLCKFLCL